jgi:hypothetical protein
MQITVFWYVAPYSLVERYLRIWKLRFLSETSVSIRLHGVTSKKTVIFIVTAIRTSKPVFFEAYMFVQLDL